MSRFSVGLASGVLPCALPLGALTAMVNSKKESALQVRPCISTHLVTFSLGDASAPHKTHWTINAVIAEVESAVKADGALVRFRDFTAIKALSFDAFCVTTPSLSPPSSR